MEVISTSQPVFHPVAKSSGESFAMPQNGKYSSAMMQQQGLSLRPNQTKVRAGDQLAPKTITTDLNNVKKTQQERTLTKEQAGQLTEQINEFMERLNTDIHFTLHEKTEQLILQVINRKDGEVIKEIPSEEMLNMIAKISEYVGVLLDKKA